MCVLCRYGAVGGGADLERATGWHESWTEEAVVHYLNLNGFDVPLRMEDSLLEEDRAALAAQDAAVKYGGVLSKEALVRNPPVLPGRLPYPMHTEMHTHTHESTGMASWLTCQDVAAPSMRDCRASMLHDPCSMLLPPIHALHMKLTKMPVWV